MSKLHRISKSFRVEDGRKFRLKDFDPGDTGGFKSQDHAKKLLEAGVDTLSEMQQKLYAQDCWALLLIFQAMDAAGKDSTIRHVMSGVNPQGCQVFSFKAPSAEELDHDYLWRTTRCLPERGRIGIFNRSYYEETLVVRVHPEILERQKLPDELVTKHIWKERFEDICAFERYATRNGIAIRKFFLNVSRDEQKERLLSRLDQADKNWKFSVVDAKERAPLGRLHAGVRGDDSAHRDAARAVVRRAGRSQMVHAARGRGRGRRRAQEPQPGLPEGHESAAQGARRRARDAQEREVMHGTGSSSK